MEVSCNFKGYKEKIKFFLIDNLPHPFLLGYPFCKKRGAVFDLTKPTVTLSTVNSKPTINLLGTSDEDTEVFGLLTGNNALLCSFNQDISEEEAQLKLQSLLQEFSWIFDSSDKTPIKAAEIDNSLKPQFKDKIFHRTEPSCSQYDQDKIDKNAD